MPIQELLLKTIVSIGQKAISSVISFEKMSSVISFLSNQLYSICSEIRASQLDAAADSIENAQRTKSIQIATDELNKAIVHLEDAYYLSKRLLDKKYVHEYSYLIIFTGKEEIDAVPWKYKKDWLQGQIEICTTLTLIYRYKGDIQLEQKWYDKSISLYQSFAKRYLQLSTYDLENINKISGITSKNG